MENRTYTQTKNLEKSTVLSWVYILYNLKSREMKIGLSFNPPKRFGRFDTAQKLVYYRNYSSPFDALAHKFLLESLSAETVMHNIKQVNPTLNDLESEIKNHRNNNLNQ